MITRASFLQRVKETCWRRASDLLFWNRRADPLFTTGKLAGTSLKGGDLGGILIILIGNGFVFIFREGWKLSPISV